MYLDLNDKQVQILNYIKGQLNAKGYPPSVREICVAVNLRSTSTVHSHLNKLEKKGYIRRDPTKPRAIEILDAANLNDTTDIKQEILQIPLVGQITAGQPILAVENIDEYIPLPANLVSGKENFLLKVKGESMVNAGILDGDYIVIDKTPVANNGDIVVALIENETSTVKRFFKDKDFIRLQPENDFMEPIILDINKVSIIGKVTGVFRVIK